MEKKCISLSWMIWCVPHELCLLLETSVQLPCHLCLCQDEASLLAETKKKRGRETSKGLHICVFFASIRKQIDECLLNY